jgi:hypothetical protein
MRFEQKRRRMYGPIVICSTTLAFGILTLPPQAQAAQNPDVTQSEVANFDAFLDAHADIDRDLRANPSLINNAQYLQNHPQLQSYLGAHPRVTAELREDPNFFMRREQRFDAREARRDADRDRDATAQNPNPDLRRRDLARMDQFLDQNPDIDRDLQRNPSLINNADYLRDHPLLARYLNQNPAMKEEFKENPNFFMQREQRFDQREADRDRDRDATGQNPNPDLRRRDLARMDQFLDQNPDIDRDLQRNPSLINNADYLRDHPLLARYLNQNPAMKEEFKENPNFFMQREQRFDAREDRRDFDRDRDAGQRDADRDRDRDRTDRDANRRNPNPDLTTGEVASMDQFLDDHKQIAKDLEKNPNLVDDQKFLNKHKDLRTYLDQHPAVREEARENPGYFMHREERFEASARDRADDRVRVTDRGVNTRRDGDDRRGADNDVSRQEVQQMDHFLDKHKKIAKDLEKDPQLANNTQYLNKHKDLKSFIASNPKVGEELRENPSRLMQDEARFEQKTRMNHPPATKTKVEQHEETHSPQHP